jgi:hypothetical protein
MEGTAGWVQGATGRRARDVVAKADVEAFVFNVRFRQECARYPELFAATNCEPAVPSRCEVVAGETTASPSGHLFHRERTVEGGSGLVVKALRHADLSPPQRQALGTFRLEQCVLCGWYDAAAVLEGDIHRDPACELLADDAIHLVVGTREGLILSYFCLEPVSTQAIVHRWAHTVWSNQRGASNAAEGAASIPEVSYSMADGERPLFATERDLFGPAVFATVPQLASAPVSRVREVNYLMRNQVVQPTSRLVSLAVVEAISGVGQLLFTFAPPLVALVGNMDIEARRLLHDLDVPVLYAPHMPVTGGEQRVPWSAEVDTPGRFWPFIIAADDLQVDYREYVMWLDAILGLPVGRAVLALMTKRRGPKVQPPLAFAQTPRANGEHEGEADGPTIDVGSPVALQEWTADPGCDTRLVAPAPADRLTRVVAVRSGLAAR